MVERGRRKLEHLLLRKGANVTLREDLSVEDLAAVSSDFVPGTVYRIFHIERHANGTPDSVWLGPGDATDVDIKAFKLESLDEYTKLQQAYPGVNPLRIDFLKKA